MIFERVLKPLYNHLIRPLSPARIALVDGVGIPGRVKALDRTQHFHDWERSAVDFIREYVEDGDQVTILGGGIGVTAAVAGRRSGPDGCITVYEPDRERHDLIREVWDINEVPASLDLKLEAVGTITEEGKEILDVQGDYDTVRADELASCDVIEIDIEGAELEVLSNLTIRPRIIVIETHGVLGVPTEQVASTIEHMGYEILKRETEHPQLGIDVLAARLKESTD